MGLTHKQICFIDYKVENVRFERHFHIPNVACYRVTLHSRSAVLAYYLPRVQQAQLPLTFKHHDKLVEITGFEPIL